MGDGQQVVMVGNGLDDASSTTDTFARILRKSERLAASKSIKSYGVAAAGASQILSKSATEASKKMAVLEAAIESVSRRLMDDQARFSTALEASVHRAASLANNIDKANGSLESLRLAFGKMEQLVQKEWLPI